MGNLTLAPLKCQIPLGLKLTEVALLLDNPVSDLGNPDCLDFQVS